MDIYNIRENLAALEEIGCTLNTAERMKLEMGLLRLTETAKHDQLLFWGKVTTNGQPYYIAMGINFKDQYAFPHKVFYWSSSNMEFKQLPPLDAFHKEKVDGFFGLPFSGDANTVLINVQGEEGQENKEKPPEVNPDSEEEEKVKVVPKNFTELDRLSYTVNSIQIECQMVPVGGLRLTEKHEIRYNEAFKGLRLEKLNICQFQHFRYPLDPAGIRKLQKPESVFAFDFLQPIQNESQWSLQTNTTRQWVTLRSLIWQGYVAFHRLGSGTFGGIYYGNGIKAVDVPFFI